MRGADDEVGQYGPWPTRLLERLAERGRVLDLGCGCGVPVARKLSAAGHEVTGVDISAVQIVRARRLVPPATFLRADADEADLPQGRSTPSCAPSSSSTCRWRSSPPLIARMASRLRVGGWSLATVGHGRWTGCEDGGLGGDATMWWSHADAATYRSWIEEGDGDHALVWARRPGP